MKNTARCPSLRHARDAPTHVHSEYALLASVIVAAEGATFHDVPHFASGIEERIVRDVGYGLWLEGASAADLVKSMQANSEPVARKGTSA